MEKNKLFKLTSAIFIWIFRLAYLVVGLAIIYILFYLFAYRYLQGPLVGNDLPNAFIYIQWLDRYWPKIPIWWPQQGGGGSFIYGHQIGSYFIILFFHRMLGLSLIQAMRFLGFLSIFLTTVGIYFFAWLKTKSQTASLLAGIFYLLSDIVWAWLFDMGLYAQAISFIFVLPVLIFFDRYLDAYKNKQETKKRIFLFLASLFYACLVFSHIVSGVMIAIVLPLYALAYFQLEKWDRKRILRVWDGIKTSALVGILGLCLLAFWIFPYMRYFYEAGRDKVTLPGAHQIPYFNIRTIFGFIRSVEEFEMWLVTLWLGAGVLFLVGLILAALRKKRSLLAWGLVALFFFLLIISPSINHIFMKIFYHYFAGIGVRGILVVSTLFPVLAGYACVALPRTILSAPGWLLSKIGVRLGRMPTFFFRQIGNLIVFIIALAIGAAAIYYFKIPGDFKKCGPALYIGYGPGSHLPYCRSLPDAFKEKKLPPFVIDDKELIDAEITKELIEKVDPGIEARIDITPSYGNIMQRWNIYSNTSQISLYAYGLSLIRAMWGYQQGLFYGPEDVNPGQIAEAAKWFGIQRAVVKKGAEDNLDNYSEEYWKSIYETEGMVVFNLRQKVNLVELSSRPTFLVIGEHQLRAYEQIFKLANQGAFAYDGFYLVEGESRLVDSYSSSELAQFDGLILYSYDYKNRGKAEKLLADYVGQGGRLWIETGWQYNSPDWEREETAIYIPLESQSWVNLGVVSNYQLNEEIIQGVDEGQFAPLQWENTGWGFSSARNALKDWARPVLSVSGYPLIAVGQYGQGRVVWSGMNLFSHAYDKENPEEVKLIGALASWLSANYVGQEGEIVWSRSNPDKVNFTLKTPAKWLLFKESYSPYWRAKIKTLDNKTYPLKFYRAGPGWVLIYFPEEYRQANAIVELEYVQSWAGYLGQIISPLTFIGFILYLAGMEKKILGERRLKSVRAERISAQIKGWWEKEDEI